MALAFLTANEDNITVTTEGTAITLLTAAAAPTKTKLNSCYVSNIDGVNTAYIYVFIDDTVTKVYKAFKIPIPPESSLDLVDAGWTLAPGEILKCYASAAGDLAISVSGVSL